jgi:hypothetical protein
VLLIDLQKNSKKLINPMQLYSLTAKRYALAIALLILSSLILRVYLSAIELGSVSAALADLTRFFTVLTNFMVMAVMFRIALAKKTPSASFVSAFVMALTGVGLVYHALLSHLWDPQGLALLADHLVHTIAPLLVLLWWVSFIDHSQLNWRMPGAWIAWPLIYSVYALVRSSFSQQYPYPFLDAATHGYGQVFINLIGLSAAFFIIGSAMIVLAKWRTLNSKIK